MVEWKKLGEVCTNLDYKRKPITSSKRVAGAYPYYGASGIVDYVEDYIFDGEFLLVSEDGANLIARSNPIAFTIQGKSWVNNHAHVLEFDNKITQKFVELYLNKIDLSPWINGAAQPKLNQANLNIIGIPVPSLEEQQRIVSILDTFTSSISNLKQQIEERRKQYEYERDLLLDLEGKEGVEMKKLGEIAKVLRGKRLTKNLLDDNAAYPVYHGGLEPLGRYNQFNREANTVMVINVGASAGTVGFCDCKFWSSDGCFCISHSERLKNKYLFYYLQTKTHYLQSQVRHAGIPTLDNPVIEKIEIPLRSLEDQQHIVSILDTFEASIKNLEKQLALREKQYEYYRNKLLTFE